MLLSDEPTITLVDRARAGDRSSLEALLQRSLPELKRWAHGKLPPFARSYLDTSDIVQETALHALRNLDHFEPEHVYSMQRYLRRAVVNRIRDELRRLGRNPPAEEILVEPPSSQLSALEIAIRAEEYGRYRAALEQASARDRQLIVARIEMQWSYSQVASRLGLPTANAARVGVFRALKRLNAAVKCAE